MIKNVLVALDTSEIAPKVVDTLDKLILSPDSTVVFCHVFPTADSEIELPADRPHPESTAVAYFQMEKQLQAYQENLSVKTQLELVTGDPAQEIIRLANIYQTDLIIIGSRGLTGVKRIVLGSVSNQVVEEANCSVLVVKSN